MKTASIFPFLFIGLVVMPTIKAFAQSKEDTKKHAVELIVKLKSGALLIQLQTKKLSIEAYREKGYESIAEDIAEQQKTDNIKIITAFNESFHFCKVYFFVSDQIDLVKEKRWDRVDFYNQNYEKDSNIVLEEDFYLIGVYATTGGSDEGQYKSLLSFNALIIKDDTFTELKKPFPYYLKIPSELPKLKKLKTKVYNYDMKLRDFYYQNAVKKSK